MQKEWMVSKHSLLLLPCIHIKFQALNQSPHCKSGLGPMCNNCEFESLQLNVDHDSGV